MVELDDTYAPKSAPTVFKPGDLPDKLFAFEDPRVFVHHGELYLLAFGAERFVDGTWQGWQYLAKIERGPVVAANVTIAGDGGPAGFRVVQPRRLLVPKEVPSGLILPPDMDITKVHREKNWVPFIHEDSIHFMYYINPPIVIRVPKHVDAVGTGDIRTEFVSASNVNSSIRWRYGEMRGGTSAVYLPEMGAHIGFFHSRIHFKDPNAGRPRIKGSKPFLSIYYMGCYVFAAQPPFAVQFISVVPVVGPGFYNFSAMEHTRQIIWPAGLVVQPDAFIVSYGKSDSAIGVSRFNRRKLMETLQAPVPKSWTGPPC